MQNTINKIKETLSKQGKLSDNKKVILYLVFVFIATIFWFLNALSKDYTTTVSFPVNYVNFPKDKALVKDLPDELFLEVEGGGFALLRYKISTAFQPINLNINNHISKRESRNNLLDYTMHMNNPRTSKSISRQLNKDIQLIKILPDTIGLHFSNIIEKKVCVCPKVNITYANQYSLNGKIITEPDSIVVAGPSTIIDTLKKVCSSVITFEDLDRSAKRNTSLEKIDNIRFSKKRVVVKIPVDRYTEATKDVEISALNLPDSLNIRFFPSYIKVNYRVGLTNFDKVSEKDFKASVDCKSVGSNVNNLKVKLDSFPDYIKDIKISPSLVEFIIEKKNK